MSSPLIQPEILTPAAPDVELHAALMLALRMLPPPTAEALRWSVIAETRRTPAALGVLAVARNEQRGIAAAAWGQLGSGNVAQVWPTQWLVESELSGCDPLMSALLAELPKRGMTFAQTLLPDVACRDAQTVLGAGFTHAADLTYLGADVDPRAKKHPEGSVRFVPYEADDRTSFAALVEGTYEGTLDCPALNGLRPALEVLDEYAEIGASGTSLWQRAVENDVAVGCLLLADHPSQNQVELVYMALLPHARGRGLGAELVRESLRIAAVLGRKRIVLAVDAANTPAAAQYEVAGFREWERRSAFVQDLRGPRADDEPRDNSRRSKPLQNAPDSAPHARRGKPTSFPRAES
ncbi:MAG: hypothetical protein C0483_19975 [Pirellula sp.]|nr:hypothetical protein [Pirellula sp.]